MRKTSVIAKVERSIAKLENWIESNDYKGYEAFDGLSSPLYKLTFKSLLAERILQQAVRQCPINLRPLLGIKPLVSTKGRGYIAWGYLKMYALTQKQSYRQRAMDSLQWLMENKSPFHEEHSWGNHFEYSARGGRIPIYEPTIVWTSLIGQAFLDAYDLFKNDEYLRVGLSVRDWILKLDREKANGGACLSYVAYGQSSIHNSNMLGAALLARISTYVEDEQARQAAHEAMAYSCNGQLPHGGWYYGQAEKFHWIDNFHTGYNLDSLKCYCDCSNDPSFQENLERGYRYFKDTFFEPSGRPKYYHNRAYPIDIQCASQAIDTLVTFSDRDPDAIELACRVAQWTIRHMQDRSGYFYYRILPIMKVKIPMIHWGQATMYKSLSHLLHKLSGK